MLIYIRLHIFFQMRRAIIQNCLCYICKAKLLQLKLIYIFARAILILKKLEIRKIKPTFNISDLKVEN